MAVPKRKTSKARRNRRASANKAMSMKNVAYNPNSGSAIAPHTVCPKTGYYKGVKVIVTKADRDARRAEQKAQAEGAAAEQQPAVDADVQTAVAEAKVAKETKKKAAPKKAAAKKAEPAEPMVEEVTEASVEEQDSSKDEK